MEISEEGLRHIRRWEGLRIKPYLDAAGYATIGVGHLILKDGKRLKGYKGLHTARLMYPDFTEEDAYDLLKKDLVRFEKVVNRQVTAPMEQHEYDAFVSLAFNIGTLGFRNSSALREHNAGNKHLVPSKIKLWNKAGGRRILGLVNRRNSEAKMYEGN